jgi:hypothetical protein
MLLLGLHLARSAASIGTAVAFERETRSFKLPVDAYAWVSNNRRQAFNSVALSMMPNFPEEQRNNDQHVCQQWPTRARPLDAER